MRLVMLGGTGSGKGTQTAKISTRLNIPCVSTGDIFREAIAADNDLGKEARTYVENGELVGDRLTIQLIQQRLLQPDVSDGWILEGYPRTAFQAEELDFLLKKIKQQLDWAIYLKVSAEIMTQRALDRGMEDDRVPVIERRIQNFQESTLPILEYYDYCQRLLTIDGEKSADEVEQEIFSFLNRAT